MAQIGVSQYFILFPLLTLRLAYDSTVNESNSMKLFNHSEVSLTSLGWRGWNHLEQRFGELSMNSESQC